MTEEDEPLCPLCKTRPRSFDSEPPGPGGYSSHCTECSMLICSRDHAHTHYPNPAHVAAGAYPTAGCSWRTTVTLLPAWEDGRHVGYRCAEFSRCGWEVRFTPEERERCPTHTQHPDRPVSKGACRDYREHRQERGEQDERGYITAYGREQEQLRSDAAVWDPGQYIERTMG